MWKKGCYVHGLFLEGARWSLKNRCLEKSLPKVLVEPLPILSIQPIEAHRLKLQVSSIDKDAKSDTVEIERAAGAWKLLQGSAVLRLCIIFRPSASAITCVEEASFE